MRYAIWFRKRVYERTDYGISHRWSWGEWGRLYSLPTQQEADESAASWGKLNPGIQYEVRPE